MTTLAKAVAVRGAVNGRNPAATTGGVRMLLTRLIEESDRQVPFSQAKLLFREAAAAIARLEVDLTRVTAELERTRTPHPAR
jgi:hypothetical protein